MKEKWKQDAIGRLLYFFYLLYFFIILLFYIFLLFIIIIYNISSFSLKHINDFTLDMTIFPITILFVSSNFYVSIKFDKWLIGLNCISILIFQIFINYYIII